MNFSIITATLDSEETLRRTVDSTLLQDVLPYEYIFIDGGSTDKTREIINSIDFARHGITLLLENQKERTGIYGAINQGIKAANGEIIFILHSDDWLEPGAAKTALAKFAEAPDCDIVLAQAYLHDTDGKISLKSPRSFFLFPLLMPLIHPAAFVRKSVYEKYGFYNENFAVSSDYDFFYRLYKNKVKFCEIRKPLVNVQLGGYANTHREKARKETLQIGLKHCRSAIPPLAAYAARLLSGR